MKLLLIALCLTLIKAECPTVNDLPVYFNDDTFFCARFYYGKGDDLALHACNGCGVAHHADIKDGQNEDAGDGYQFPVGSLLVRPGCTFYQFHDDHYNGGYNVWEGPGLWPNVRNGPDSEDHSCAKGRPGIMCR